MNDQSFLPFHRPTIYPHHAEAVADVVRSGWITSASKVEEFEQKFAEYIGAKHVVMVNSCTAAIHLALIALGVGPGDEVLTSPITFASAVNVIEHVGARPVFVDVLDSDLTIDPELARKAVTHRTRAIIATQFAGASARISELEKIGVPVIVDAAHGVETKVSGRPSGQLGKISCYSFYATKNITTGEGGAFSTNDDGLAEQARLLRLHGMTKDAWKRYGPGGYRHWDIVRPGWKYNMSDIQATLGIEQLAEIDLWQNIRKVLLAGYYEQLRSPRIRFVQTTDPSVESAHHLFVIRVPERDRVMEVVQENGVGVGVHFRAVHRLEYYHRKYAIPRKDLPIAEAASEEVLSLPLYPSLTRGNIERVVTTLEAAIK